MATITIASSRLGSVRMMSISRMIAISVMPRRNPAIIPSVMPTTMESATTAMPISSDRRAPWISRDRMSRPIASVPSGYAHEPPACQAGGWRNTALLVRSGGYGASTFANAAISSTAMTTTSPPTAPRLALK